MQSDLETDVKNDVNCRHSVASIRLLILFAQYKNIANIMFSHMAYVIYAIM